MVFLQSRVRFFWNLACLSQVNCGTDSSCVIYITVLNFNVIVFVKLMLLN